VKKGKKREITDLYADETHCFNRGIMKGWQTSDVRMKTNESELNGGIADGRSPTSLTRRGCAGRYLFDSIFLPKSVPLCGKIVFLRLFTAK
jgi:hypothetical protein